MTRDGKVSIIIFNTVKRESARRKELPMIATVINVILILLGSLLGLACKEHIKPRFAATLTSALGLCVMGIGVSSMIATEDTLCVIVCMVVGTLLGEALRIEDRLEGIGTLVRGRLLRGGGSSRFAEGFVNATVLFCVGAMAINGSLEAGLNHNYSILISKSVIDGVTAITFASAMGVGVAFCVVPPLSLPGGIDAAGPVCGALSAAGCSGGDERGRGDHHRGHRPEYVGAAPGEDPGGQYAARDVSAHGLSAPLPVAAGASVSTIQKALRIPKCFLFGI